MPASSRRAKRNKRPYRVSRKRALVEATIPVVDWCLAPIAVLIAPLLFLIARLGWRAGVTRSILDRVGVALLRHHYYSPVVFPSDVRTDLDAARDLPGIDLRENEQVALLDRLSAYSPEASVALADFDFDNPNYGRVDALVLYAMIREFGPKRVFEIGSGHSTRVVAAALAQGPSPARHVCMEPFEMPWLEATGATVLRMRVEDAPLSLFAELEAGDVLFIDSSHAIRPQGDVVREYLEILPMLAPGVIVHVHDVYTPHDLHPYLVLGQRKIWDEQYLMEALLSGGDRFEVMLANYWIGRANPGAFARVVPGFTLPPERDGCSFWLRRR
ncbi:MAG TPA: class I SAM-dependent methyltransferase [Novosphingobium sp.]|nr:class I SAM-dependent methyltransferase [Novosphingobium sp.]